MEEQIWEPARLIPITGIGGAVEQERRATSALLAVIGAVDEFSRAILKPLGAPAGTVSVYCEVPFEIGGKAVRPDGVIRVSRGKREWTILVEVKTGNNRLDTAQVENYLEVCRQEGFDGLLTISNHIAQIVGQHHVDVNKVRFGRVPLHHLSWFRILAQAIMVRQHTGVSDPDQAWILSELIRYLEYKGSGALGFDDMGKHWVPLRASVRAGALEESSEEALDIAARWDQLIQYLCLDMTTRLGFDVLPAMTQKESGDPAARTRHVAAGLATDGRLEAAIRVPSAIDRIEVTADLRASLVTTTVAVEAPKFNLGVRRLNWIVRQLDACPPDTRLDIRYERASRVRSGMLEDVRKTPDAYLREDGHRPRSFAVAVNTKMGFKRGRGQGSFIDSVLDAVNSFYTDVVGGLKPPG